MVQAASYDPRMLRCIGCAGLLAVPAQSRAVDGPAQSRRRWRYIQAENLYTTSMQLRVMCAEANWNSAPSPQLAAAQPGPSPMDAAAFAGLLTAVRQQTFDDGKLAVIWQAAKANWFTAQQLISTVDVLKFSTGKLVLVASVLLRCFGKRQHSF